jgi:hypothetical protein
MQFIGQTWWVWMIIMLIAGAFSFMNQARRMKSVMRGEPESFTDGLTGFAISALVGLGSGLLFVVGVAWQIIHMLKN